LAAQAFVFFLAGFETSSTTMTFCLFELASNPDIQEKLRQEIYEVLKRHDNKLTYDATMEMHYMEKVINGKNIFELLISDKILICRNIEEISASSRPKPYLYQGLQSTRK
jgi:hypothetical protein